MSNKYQRPVFCLLQLHWIDLVDDPIYIYIYIYIVQRDIRLGHSKCDIWKKIYREIDDVNKVQHDIRLGHSKTVENVMKMLTDEGSLQGVTICDAGFGMGCLAILLAKEGAVVYASDISAAMVSEAERQSQADGMITHLVSLAENWLILSFAPKTFYYDLLKRVGELFPGPSKATRAYLHAKAEHYGKLGGK